MPRHHLRMTCLLALAGVPLLAACGADDPALPSPPTSPAAAVQTAPTIGRYPAPAAALPAEAPTSRSRCGWPRASSSRHSSRWRRARPSAGPTPTPSRTPSPRRAGAAAFDSGTIEAGGEFTWTATGAGRVSYACVFHPGMTGTIVVR